MATNTKKGGARPGAGRPPGSKYLDLIGMLRAKGKKDHKNEDHYIEEFVDFLLANYMEDTRLMTWMGEHIFGKPAQPLSNPDGTPLIISFDSIFNEKKSPK